MQKKGQSAGTLFLISALIFSLAAAAGMFFAYHLGDELKNSLGEYVKYALKEKSGIKETFSRAANNDFRYTAAVLLSAFSVYTTILPLCLVGFKGFCSGLAVAVASATLSGSKAIFTFSAAVFISCLVTVPVHILMYILSFKFALRMRQSTEKFSLKAKGYMEFFFAVMLMFFVLLAVDFFHAVIGLLK